MATSHPTMEAGSGAQALELILALISGYSTPTRKALRQVASLVDIGCTSLLGRRTPLVPS